MFIGDLAAIFFYDLVYYGKLATSVLKYGIESRISIYGSFTDVNHQMLYHYGDLWLVGLISNLFNFQEVKVLIYVMYPLLHFIVLSILLSIYSEYGKIKAQKILLIVGLLYGIKLFLNIDFGNEVLNASKQYSGLPYPTTANKLLVIYLLLLLSYSLYKIQFVRLSLIVLSFLPIFYSVTSPAIAGIAVFILLFSLLNKKLKITQWDIKFKDSLYILISIVFLLIYTTLYSFKKSEELILQFYSVKTYIVLLIETIVKIFLEYFLILILFVYVFLKSKARLLLNPWIVISFIGFFSGYLFIYVQAPGTFNLHQAISTISPVFMLIITIELMTYLNTKSFFFISILFCIFGIWNLLYFKQIPKEFGIRKTSTTFSFKFKKEVESYIESSSDEFRSCTIRTIATNEFRDGDNSSWEYDFQNKFQDLYYSNKSPFPLEIGNLFSESKEIYSKSHPYYKMYKDGKVSTSRIITFLKRKKVAYIFVEDVKIVPNEFLSNFNLLFNDKLTGGSLWKLKKAK